MFEHRDSVFFADRPGEILEVSFCFVVHHYCVDPAVYGFDTVYRFLKTFFGAVISGDEPLVRKYVGYAEAFFSFRPVPVREYGSCEIRVEVNAADAEKVVQLCPVIIENLEKRSCQSAAGSDIVPAGGVASHLYVDDRYRVFYDEFGVSDAVVYAGPVRAFCRY